MKYYKYPKWCANMLYTLLCAFKGGGHVEEIWFKEPNVCVGFKKRKDAELYAKQNNGEVNKTINITEEKAMEYMICSDAGYIFSMSSCYYGRARHAFLDAINNRWYVVRRVNCA